MENVECGGTMESVLALHPENEKDRERDKVSEEEIMLKRNRKKMKKR